ncbi:MAG: acetyl-CoA carboxylase biotin carboxyl carrier protein [Deltaproteobacteria bacterium]
MGFINKDELMEILKIVAESNVAEFHLETGELKFSLKKNRRAESERQAEALPEATALDRQGEEPPAHETGSARPGVLDAPAPEGMPAPALDAEGLIPIRAPMLGTFYRAPKPGAPPFVEVGQFVTEEDVVCIIEVMKLFNTVKAGVSGRIAKICAENAQLVEYKEVLFFLEEALEHEAEEEQAP